MHFPDLKKLLSAKLLRLTVQNVARSDFFPVQIVVSFASMPTLVVMVTLHICVRLWQWMFFAVNCFFVIAVSQF